MKRIMMTALCGSVVVAAIGTMTSEEPSKKSNLSVSGSASADIASGYILYGARLNDRPTFMQDVRLDFSYSNWGYIGGYIWCNSDLTNRRHQQGIGKAFNEYDFYIHYGNSFCLTDTIALSFELSHVWYWYPSHRHGNDKGYNTTHELCAYAELATPWLTTYAFISHEYLDVHGTVLYGGLKHDFALTDTLTLTPDLQVIGMSENYMGVMFPWKANGAAPCDTGVAAVQASLKAEYALTSYLKLRGTVAYVTIASDDVRSAIDTSDADSYRKDFVWGMIGCSFTF